MVKGRNIACLLVFSIPILLYLQSLSFKFTNFDDHLIIQNNIDFLSDAGNIPAAFELDAFCRETGTFYRPLQLVSYMIDMQLGENYFSSLHLTNIVLYALVFLLLYGVLLRFLIPWQTAALGTIVFSVHPLFVSLATWIPARGDLLMSVFSLLSLLLLIEYLNTKRLVYLFLHWTALVIALFCKETAIVLPVLYILYYLSFHSKERFNRKYLWIVAGYAVTVMLWLWIRAWAIQDINGTSSSSGETGIMAVLNNLRIIPESVSRFFIPLDLDPIPSFTLFKSLSGLLIIGFLILGLILIHKKPKKELLFGMAWFVLFLAPTMVFRNYDTDYLDHRFLLPMAGILFSILWAISTMKRLSRNLVLGMLCVVVLLLSTQSFFASRAYANPESFYNAVITKNNRSVIGYINRGALFFENGKYENALEDYSRAIELQPENSDVYRTRGNAFLKVNQYKEAIDDFTQAIALKVADAETYNNRGVAYLFLGLTNLACDDFRMASELGSISARGNIQRFCNRH
jgi:hypothetical protein